MCDNVPMFAWALFYKYTGIVKKDIASIDKLLWLRYFYWPSKQSSRTKAKTLLQLVEEDGGESLKEFFVIHGLN